VGHEPAGHDEDAESDGEPSSGARAAHGRPGADAPTPRAIELAEVENVRIVRRHVSIVRRHGDPGQRPPAGPPQDGIPASHPFA
jgi:hypothetical protein